ncbi:nuclease-related domain-containing protein [Microbacterium sp. CJ88]|uniref:nuclease-related domain-containing protein n=1 Tax=Microbacterium sp. CJ88 TaxID=3445672 RepID=UPI003F65C3FD
MDAIDERRMTLRFSGRCRICDARLAAGTRAIYERSGRTVRCIECAVGTTGEMPAPAEVRALIASATEEASASATQAASVPTTDAATARALVEPESLRLRAPASAVIAETLRQQESAPPPSWLFRLLGRSPLTAESRPWYLGALGELEVGRVLDELGGGWTVIHAVPVGRKGADLDHVVIGPGGVFTINAKFHEGRKVWVGDARLLVNGQRTDHLRNAAFEGRRAAKALTAAVGARVDVTPIVAIVGARSIVMRGRPAEVVVLRATQLVWWLSKRPVVLSPDQVQRVVDRAVEPATWGGADAVPADLARFAQLRDDVVSAARRRFAWATAVLLAVCAWPVGTAVTTLIGMLRAG